MNNVVLRHRLRFERATLNTYSYTTPFSQYILRHDLFVYRYLSALWLLMLMSIVRLHSLFTHHVDRIWKFRSFQHAIIFSDGRLLIGLRSQALLCVYLCWLRHGRFWLSILCVHWLVQVSIWDWAQIKCFVHKFMRPNRKITLAICLLNSKFFHYYVWNSIIW